MNKPTSSESDIFLQIICRGLELWIRSKCEYIHKVKLEIKGSVFQLFRGHIKGVSVIANEVSFQGLLMHHVCLTSTPLSLNLLSIKKNQALISNKSFNIKGSITFTEEGLNAALVSGSMRWLGEWLAKNLMKLDKLWRIDLTKNSLELKACKSNGIEISKERFILQAKKGRVIILDERQGETLLPMDPEIEINQALITENKLILKGIALVKP